MKSFLFILLSLNTVLSFSQEEENPVKKINTVYFEVGGSSWLLYNITYDRSYPSAQVHLGKLAENVFFANQL
jgi:hypothetical protein